MRSTLHRSVLPLALQAKGYEALHASSIVHGGRVFAFCADSGTGKSTLANALRSAGYLLWTDDALVLNSAIDAAAAIPLPFHPRLGKRSPIWIRSGKVPETARVRGIEEEHFDPSRSLTMLVGAIFFLKRVEEDDSGGREALVLGPTLQPLSATDALVHFLTHAYVFNVKDVARRRRMTESYLDLAAAVPVFRLTIPTGLERLPNVVASLGECFDRLKGNSIS